MVISSAVSRAKGTKTSDANDTECQWEYNTLLMRDVWEVIAFCNLFSLQIQRGLDLNLRALENCCLYCQLFGSALNCTGKSDQI